MVRWLLNFLTANSVKSAKLNTRFCNYAGQLIYGKPNDFGPSGTLGIYNNSKLLGVVVFHGWQPDYGVIEISGAASSPAWLCKRSIREIMHICFEQHQCQQIVSRMATDNERAIKIYKFLGFESVLLPNMRGKEKHEWLMVLTKDQWKTHRLNKDF